MVRRNKTTMTECKLDFRMRNLDLKGFRSYYQCRIRYNSKINLSPCRPEVKSVFDCSGLFCLCLGSGRDDRRVAVNGTRLASRSAIYF